MTDELISVLVEIRGKAHAKMERFPADSTQRKYWEGVRDGLN